MDNIKDKIAKGRESRGERHSVATKAKTPKGSKNPAAKLCEKDIPVIWQMKKRRESSQEIARSFGVCNSSIKNICSGKTWKHIKREVN